MILRVDSGTPLPVSRSCRAAAMYLSPPSMKARISGAIAEASIMRPEFRTPLCSPRRSVESLEGSRYVTRRMCESPNQKKKAENIRKRATFQWNAALSQESERLDYQLRLLPKVSFSERGKDQRGFLEAGRALISIGSPVKGFTPLPALRAFTSLRTRVPITGKRTRSPEAAAFAPLVNADSR